MFFFTQSFSFYAGVRKSEKVKTPRSIPKVEKDTLHIFKSYLKLLKCLVLDLPITLGSIALSDTLGRKVFGHVLSNNGPLGMKLGQFLSMHPYLSLNGLDICLEHLQSNSPVDKSIDVYKIFKEETGLSLAPGSVKEIVGSGCIAQVYKVSIGEKAYALKIVKPKAKKEILSDLSAVEGIANLLGLSDYFREFQRMMKQQLDLRLEKKSAEVFRSNFSFYQSALESPSFFNQIISVFRKYEFIFPKPHHATKNILLMDYWKGKKLSSSSSESVLFMFLKMVFKDRYIHADLHLGNMGCIEKKVPAVIVYDAGLVHIISRRERRNLVDLLKETLLGNIEKGFSLIVDRNKRNTISQKKRAEFIQCSSSFLKNRVERKPNIGYLALSLLRIAKKHNVFFDECYTNIAMSSMHVQRIASQHTSSAPWMYICLQTGLFSEYISLFLKWHLKNTSL